jgi:ribulose-phosphate 3-epimerase
LPGIVKVSASILAANFAKLGDDIARLEDAGCDEIHFDVMDGHFVPNISFGAPVLEAIRNLTSLPVDVHMMVTEPGRFAEQFASAGADIFTVHAEACSDLASTIMDVSAAGMRPGIAINPGTEASAVTRYVSSVPRFLVMSVEPGFGGQSFMPAVLPKIGELRSVAERHERDIDVAVDGGVKIANAPAVIEAGASTLISGTGIFNHTEGMAAAIRKIRHQ